MGNRIEQALVLYEAQDAETRELRRQARSIGQEFGTLTPDQILKLEEFDAILSEPLILTAFDRHQQALLAQPDPVEEI